MMLGSLLFDRDRQEEALVALGRVREANEGWTHARTLLAEIAIRRHDLGEAEQLLRQAAERDRRAIEPRERLVYILVLERRPAEAYSVLRELYALDRDPRRLADCILVSRIESDVRDLSPEIEAFSAQTPEDPWLRRAWGLFLLSQVGRARPSPTSKSRPRRSRMTPWGASPWRNAGWRWAFPGGSLHPRHGAEPGRRRRPVVGVAEPDGRGLGARR